MIAEVFHHPTRGYHIRSEHYRADGSGVGSGVYPNDATVATEHLTYGSRNNFLPDQLGQQLAISAEVFYDLAVPEQISFLTALWDGASFRSDGAVDVWRDRKGNIGRTSEDSRYTDAMLD